MTKLRICRTIILSLSTRLHSVGGANLIFTPFCNSDSLGPRQQRHTERQKRYSLARHSSWMLFRNVFIVMLQPEYGGSKPPRNVGDCLPVRTALQPRRPESSSILPREFQIFNSVIIGTEFFSSTSDSLCQYHFTSVLFICHSYTTEAV
jgi:hypothetical protein